MRIVVETQMRTLSPERNRTFGLFRSILASAPQGTNGERGGGRGGDINAHQYFSARFRSKSVRTQESRVNSGFETPFSKDVRSSSTVKRTEDSQETADGADYLSVHVSAYVCFANTEI